MNGLLFKHSFISKIKPGNTDIRMNRLLSISAAFILMLLLPPVLRAEGNNMDRPGKSNLIKKITPTYAKLQYAGGMGMFSMGCGWHYAKKRLESDLIVGVSPASYHFDNSLKHMLYILTLKQNYYPWSLKIKKNISFEPLTTGAYATLILNKNKDLWLTQPDRYGKGYYWHSNRIRLHLFAGERISFDLKKNKSIQTCSFFYEVSTCDLYIVNAVNSKAYGLRDILIATLGVRFSFF